MFEREPEQRLLIQSKVMFDGDASGMLKMGSQAFRDLLLSKATQLPLQISRQDQLISTTTMHRKEAGKEGCAAGIAIDGQAMLPSASILFLSPTWYVP